MEILKADITYVDKIVEIENDSFTSDKWNKEQWENEFTKNEFAIVLLLIDQGNVIGYIDYWILFEQATISKMCIKNEYRKQGLGDLLLKAALKNIDRSYCISTSLEVRVSNIGAIRLYEKNLFKTELIKKGYYSDGEDCYFMIRSIGDVYA